MVRARRNGIVILFLMSLVPVIRLWAQSGVDNIATKNDTTKRSTIVEVDGYAYISEDKTPRQMREEALANAKREALERAQTYIKSVTKVDSNWSRGLCQSIGKQGSRYHIGQPISLLDQGRGGIFSRIGQGQEGFVC